MQAVYMSSAPAPIVLMPSSNPPPQAVYCPPAPCVPAVPYCPPAPVVPSVVPSDAPRVPSEYRPQAIGHRAQFSALEALLMALLALLIGVCLGRMMV